jgi:uncharacterized protein YebE (UPF0316 family)
MILEGLMIFGLRMIDVSIGTLRVVATVRGLRTRAVTLAFLESAIFIVALSTAMKGANDPWKMAGYAGGFAAGTFFGITLERWIASGWIMVRAVSREKTAELRQRLRERHFGVTTIKGEGYEGDLSILFIVAPRKRGKELLGLIQEVEPDGFVTVESVSRTIGGYLPAVAEATSVRK